LRSAYTDADTNTNGHAYSHAEADPDAAATPDTLPAPDALARGWNSLCGNSRKKLASSRGARTGNFANSLHPCALGEGWIGFSEDDGR